MRLTVLALLLCATCLAGCVENRQPLALASVGSADPSGALPLAANGPLGPSADDRSAAARPQPDQIVAVRGGDIMIAPDDERAARRRQLAMLKNDLEKVGPAGASSATR